MKNRTLTTCAKIYTEFGPFFVHIDTDLEGRALGANITHANKNEESQISRFVEQLSDGLRMALARSKGDEIDD